VGLFLISCADSLLKSPNIKEQIKIYFFMGLKLK